MIEQDTLIPGILNEADRSIRDGAWQERSRSGPKNGLNTFVKCDREKIIFKHFFH